MVLDLPFVQHFRLCRPSSAWFVCWRRRVRLKETSMSQRSVSPMKSQLFSGLHLHFAPFRAGPL